MAFCVQLLHVQCTQFYVGSSPLEKSMLQISNPNKKNKVTTVDVSNIVMIKPDVEQRTITIVLPDDSELILRAESYRLLVLWIAVLKVSMSKGTYMCGYVCVLGLQPTIALDGVEGKI